MKTFILLPEYEYNKLMEIRNFSGDAGDGKLIDYKNKLLSRTLPEVGLDIVNRLQSEQNIQGIAPPTTIANSTTSIPKSSAPQQGVQKQTTPRRNVVQNKQTGLFEQEVFSTPPPPGEILKAENQQDPTLNMEPAIKASKREVELLHYLQGLDGYKVDPENDRITSLSTNRTVRTSHLIRAILRKNGDLTKVNIFLQDIIPDIPGTYIKNEKLRDSTFGGALLNKKFPTSWIQIF